MAKQPQTETTKLSQLRTSPMDEETIDEVEMETQDQGFYDVVYNMAEKLAATRLGQFVIERSDRLLRMIEDTAKWSLPQDKSEEKLVRPFNWITFLSLIITLRMIRMTLSIAAVMIGNSPVSAHDIVYFIQTRRRKLRAIRVHGLKDIRRREVEAIAMKSRSSEPGIIAKVKALLSIAICRPGQHREPERRVFVHSLREQVHEEQSPSEDRQSSKRPREDESVECNLTFGELLTKYANENSDDDSDFKPNSEDDSNDDDITSSDSGSADEDDVEVTKKPKTSDNDVLEVKENGGHSSIPKPISDFEIETISDSEPPLTPRENGPSSGQTHENEAQNDYSTPPCSHLLIPFLRMSTPGHESAALTAITKPVISSSSFGSTAKADPQSDDYPKTSTSFSYCIQSLSSTSLLSEDLINNFQCLERASQPSSSMLRRSSTSSLSANENSTLSSASSTKDVFYSPIGSPSDFNALFKPVSILKNPTVSTTEIGEEGNEHFTSKSSEELGNVESVDESINSAPHKKHVHHQHPHRQNQHHQNRYRNKNRR